MSIPLNRAKRIVRVNNSLHKLKLSNRRKIVKNSVSSHRFFSPEKFQEHIGIVASNFQRNRTDSIGYFPSNTSLSFSDNVASENGL